MKRSVIREANEGNMKILLLPLIALLLNLSGCAGTGGLPKTAEDFRLSVPGSSLAVKESFEVSRTFDEVAFTFEQKALTCLDVTIKTVSQADGNNQVIASNWNPTLIVTDKKAELHVQRIFEGAEKAGNEPKNGHYVMVVDITPASIWKTRIEIYRSIQGVDFITRAVKNWAAGKDIGCPDMTKN